MKSVAIFVLIMVLVSISVGFGNCGGKLETRNSEKNMTGNISDAEKLSGMKFPASAKILSAVKDSGHDGTKYQKWIIQASEPVNLKGDVIKGDNNQTFIEALEQALPDTDFGQTKNDNYEFSSWQTGKSNWQAAAIETDKGFFVKLESIILD